jgi:Tol biopolymer transport system component/phospholipase C
MATFSSATLRTSIVSSRTWLGLLLFVTLVGTQLGRSHDRAASSPLGALSSSSKGNGWIAFGSDRQGNLDIYRMDYDGSNTTRLTSDPASDSDPAWSPDGTLIAFASRRTGNGEIYVMDPDGSNVLQLSGGSGKKSQPAWSPTGDRIAYTGKEGGNEDIFVMDANGSNVVRLTTNLGRDADAAWSPAGNRIAYTSRRGGNIDVYVMRPDGSSRRRLTTDPGIDSQPAWSPDGSLIAFTSDRDGNQEIYVMGADGSGQTNLTTTAGNDSDPAFAPEAGYRLLFVSDRLGNRDVFVTWKAGTGQEQFPLTEQTGIDVAPSWQPLVASPPSGSPIEHIVVIFQENQSFDSVLGQLCIQDGRCDGVQRGEISNGSSIDLRHPSPDVVPAVNHGWYAQYDGMNGGQMNGFDKINGCTAAQDHACYQQYEPEQIPNLAALARSFVISDRTFEGDSVGSWGAHFILASPQLNGFYQALHHPDGPPDGPGWGCDSGMLGPWAPTLSKYYADHYPAGPDEDVPTCVPKQDGSGPYKPSPVPWTQTIMNRMDEAGRPWKIYAPGPERSAYGWAICPTFADCLYTSQNANHVDPEQFAIDAANGDIANLSFVIPRSSESQHNGTSMLAGDNWIGAQVDAVMNGPDWDTSAIFITYDDCGCFYDHVPPPDDGLGIRVPMVIVSPYAKAGFTDSRVASFASLQAFTEHTFGLAPMSIEDATAYDYGGSFDFSQQPLPPIELEQRPLAPEVVQWLRRHPPPRGGT